MMLARFYKLLTALFLLCSFQSLPLSAQSLLSPPKAEVKEVENDESPRFMMRRFMEVLNQNDLDLAFSFVEFPKNAALERKREIIQELFDVLNKRGKIDLTSLSNSPGGRPSDSINPDLEIIGSVDFNGNKIPIELRFSSDKTRKGWRFSSDFMEKIPDLAESLQQSGFETKLPQQLVSHQFLGVKAWQWIGLVLSLVIAVVAAMFLSSVLFYLAKAIVRYLKLVVPDPIFTGFLTPFRLFIGLFIFGVAVSYLDTSLASRQKLAYFEAIVLTISFCVFALRLTAAGIELSRLSYERQGKHTATAMLGPLRKGISIIIVLLGITFMLRDLGFDVTAIIAGLGIGGVAIALAGQKTIENLFGGISIIMDQPVRVGDFGKFGTILGTVEDIGLRSTKVRTLDRTLVAIPNAEFSHMTLENYEKRDKFRWVTTLGIRMDASTDQMRLLLMEMKELLLSHPMVYKDPARVRFTNFGPSSLNIEIFAYIKASDFNEYIAVVEDLNLRMLDIIRNAGTDLAFPAQTLYLEKSFGPDKGFMPAVEKKIAAVKDQGGFPQPFYPSSWSDERLDTLPFPEA